MVCSPGSPASPTLSRSRATVIACVPPAFESQRVELHDEALTEMVQQIRIELLSAEVLAGLKKLALPEVDFASARQLAQSALTAIRQGQLGYAILVAMKSGVPDKALQITTRT